MRALHHIALGARDVDRLAAFYVQHLGLRETARHEDDDGLRSVWLSTGSGILMIERADTAPSAPAAPRPPGWFLLAFETSPEERRALEGQLASIGHPREDATAYTSYFRDPEGNRFALSHYPMKG